jgi:hypothetical protein
MNPTAKRMADRLIGFDCMLWSQLQISRSISARSSFARHLGWSVELHRGKMERLLSSGEPKHGPCLEIAPVRSGVQQDARSSGIGPDVNGPASPIGQSYWLGVVPVPAALDMPRAVTRPLQTRRSAVPSRRDRTLAGAKPGDGDRNVAIRQ